MSLTETIRLLILNDSRDEAERLISMLRNAGRPSRAQFVENEESLVKLLQEQTWDLLIGLDNTASVPLASAIKSIRRLNKDVPVILQTEDNEDAARAIIDGMKLGAADVVKLDDDQHLLLIIQRELAAREQRQQRRLADRRYKDAERRSQQLLDSSRDAIAYVQDGLFLYANDSFAELFGYQERDDIECMPVIDMVATSDQARTKEFLKTLTLEQAEADNLRFSFAALKADDTEQPLTIEVNHASYDEEPCIEFIVRANQANNEELEAQIHQIKHQDLVTGLYNRAYLVDELEKAVSHATQKHASHSLLFIEVDQFSERVQNEFGVAGSDTVLSDVAHFLQEHVSEHDTLVRFGDDDFIILRYNTSATSALTQGEELCNQFRDHIVEVDDKTLQLTISVGVAMISEAINSGEEVISQAMQAIDAILASTKGEGNSVKLYEPDENDRDDGNTDIVTVLKKAMSENRFRLLFQPVISLRGSDEEYYEVLLRMVDENGEEIRPNHFLEAASGLGAMKKIDRWVLLESIKVLAEHRNRGNKTKLIVNIDSQSLQDQSLVDWLKTAFKAAKLSTDSLVIQANEIDITSHLNAAKSFSEGLAQIHCPMAISKFGCSLNPFSTLNHVKADFVKVDGSFTLDIQNSNEGPETLIKLVQELHEKEKVTIVPFVENASVLSTLWQSGVHYIQGHYLQAPSQDLSYDFAMDG